VVGVEHQRHVEDLRDDLVGFLGVEHVEEVRCVAQVLAGFDGVVPVAQAVEGGNRRRDLRGDAATLPEVGRPVLRVGIGVGVPCGERRDHRLQGGHRLLVGRGELLDGRVDARREGALGSHRLLEVGEFGLVREVAVPEQRDDLLVARAPRQIVDGVAAVDEFPGVAVDVTER